MRLASTLLGCTLVLGACAPPAPLPDIPTAAGSPASSAAPPAPSSPSPGAVPSPAATPRPACPTTGAVETATWTEAEGGRSLAVEATDGLRACGGPLTRWSGAVPGWQEVVALAGPEADTDAMEQQYACHLRYARTKPTWNLEPWRALVPEEDLLVARCNPAAATDDEAPVTGG